ncbi:MAG: hypothetical protein ACFFEE_05475, partial [Candidatus Thorarchaeota archaeon]
DPCAWGYIIENDGVNLTRIGIYTYTPAELSAYNNYFAQGGNLFLTALSNSSIDQNSANQLFSLFNITLNNDHVPVITIIINGEVSTDLITGMHQHFITRWIDSFDYNGCSLNYTGDVYELAWTRVMVLDANGTSYPVNKTVMVALENGDGGRLVAAGSNFFLDNWALLNQYRSSQNWNLVVQTTFWLLDILTD